MMIPSSVKPFSNGNPDKYLERRGGRRKSNEAAEQRKSNEKKAHDTTTASGFSAPVSVSGFSAPSSSGCSAANGSSDFSAATGSGLSASTTGSGFSASKIPLSEASIPKSKTKVATKVPVFTLSTASGFSTASGNDFKAEVMSAFISTDDCAGRNATETGSTFDQPQQTRPEGGNHYVVHNAAGDGAVSGSGSSATGWTAVALGSASANGSGASKFSWATANSVGVINPLYQGLTDFNPIPSVAQYDRWHRYFGARLIMNTCQGNPDTFPPRVMVTACHIFQLFFCFQRFRDVDVRYAAIASLLLACKSEESMTHLKEVFSLFQEANKSELQNTHFVHTTGDWFRVNYLGYNASDKVNSTVGNVNTSGDMTLMNTSGDVMTLMNLKSPGTEIAVLNVPFTGGEKAGSDKTLDKTTDCQKVTSKMPAGLPSPEEGDVEMGDANVNATNDKNATNDINQNTCSLKPGRNLSKFDLKSPTLPAEDGEANSSAHELPQDYGIPIGLGMDWENTNLDNRNAFKAKISLTKSQIPRFERRILRVLGFETFEFTCAGKSHPVVHLCMIFKELFGANLETATLKKTNRSKSKSDFEKNPRSPSPKDSPKSTPKPSPKSSPKPSPKSSPKPSPKGDDLGIVIKIRSQKKSSPKDSPKRSPRGSPKNQSSPRGSRGSRGSFHRTPQYRIQNKQILEKAIGYCNDSLCTSLCCRQNSEVLALACFDLACLDLGLVFPVNLLKYGFRKVKDAIKSPIGSHSIGIATDTASSGVSDPASKNKQELLEEDSIRLASIREIQKEIKLVYEYGKRFCALLEPNSSSFSSIQASLATAVRIVVPPVGNAFSIQTINQRRAKAIKSGGGTDPSSSETEATTDEEDSELGFHTAQRMIEKDVNIADHNPSMSSPDSSSEEESSPDESPADSPAEGNAEGALKNTANGGAVDSNPEIIFHHVKKKKRKKAKKEDRKEKKDKKERKKGKKRKKEKGDDKKSTPQMTIQVSAPLVDDDDI